MFVSGRSRRQLQHTLTSAYSRGLLSEDTFVARIDELAAPMIEPHRLVGDLNLRETRTAWPARALDALTRGLDRLKPLFPDDTTLLALDWDGATRELLIGRHLNCDVVLSDLQISRRHARLRFRDGRWILQDLESRNGTAVNGTRVGRCELRSGDRITIGSRRLIVD
jgi:FHA domain